MTDGINGQLLGSVMIWCALLARHASGALAVPCLVVIVSALVTIAFNLRGRLFSGSSGAYASSVFIALVAMAVYRQANNTLPASLPLIWFWLPVADCVRLMAERIASGRSPLSSDRNHIHHILLNRMRARYALLLYLFLLGAPAALAEVRPELGVAALFACAAVYVALLVSNVFEKGLGLPQPEACAASVIGFAQSQETGT